MGRRRRGGGLRLAQLVELDFFLQLLAELPCHDARAANPAAEL
jgi:hypothetical protein